MTGELVLRSLALLAIGGCAAAAIPPPKAAPACPRESRCLRYHIADAFTHEELEALEAAAVVWRNSGVCIFKTDHDGVALKRLATGADAPPSHRKVVDGNPPEQLPAIAYYAADVPAIYWIADRVGESFRLPAWINEQGHAMGAEHASDLGLCMFPRVVPWCGSAGRLSEDDLALIDQRYRH
jgi:hypothetical protein